MSHSAFKVIVMLVIIFSFLGVFGFAEILKGLIDKFRQRKRSTRLYQGQL